ncbi:class I SAM-dependent methyltransferase [Ruania albidiflava]|uniref:class I SAM-dependent methyltransferase n=2 Tax=Ruania albidiflava TaxID=366586 RepID=UPI0003B5406A|nr:class I SAM-dependent methyltransferase [Ruania albidiflava]
MVEKSLWTQKIEQNPQHSHWYVQRFRTMAASGEDLHGEARFVDAMAPRGATILDAGCGPGRVGAELAARGHRVVGVDVDPVLIDAAEADHPGPTWLVQDLAELDLHDVSPPFDVVVAAGNVTAFLAPSTRRTVLERIRDHLADEGRFVTGFGAGRGYPFDEFASDAQAAGLTVEVALESWDLRPFTPESSFLVAVLGRSTTTTPGR